MLSLGVRGGRRCWEAQSHQSLPNCCALLGQSDALRPMLPPSLSPAEILSAAENPADKGLYFLGAYHRRITFYSQQVRALRLAEALETLGLIKAGDQVAVIGGGAGGSTMAAALALLGKDVTLFDPAEKMLQLQSGSSRLLHPHIYEWPQLGSLDARAGLPILDWQSDKAGTVCDVLRGEFDKLVPSLPNLRPKLKHDVTSLERDGDSWKLGSDSPEGKETRVFQHVVLAMGFGDELACGLAIPEDYWRPGAVGTPATEPKAGATYLVSGNGDGALTELLALLVTGFEHVGFTSTFLGFFRGDALRAATEQAFAGAPPKTDVRASLQAHLRPLLVEASVLDRLRIMIRKDRQVTLNTDGPLFAVGQAAQLNQCMVFAVLEAAKLEGVTVHESQGRITDVTGVKDAMTPAGPMIAGAALVGAFKHVVLRHGPDIEQRYAMIKARLKAFEAYIRPLLAGNPLLAAPPTLTSETFVRFEKLRIEKTADLASKDEQLHRAAESRRVIEVVRDVATGVVVERGDVRLADAAEACERLPNRITVRLHVEPADIGEAAGLIRLARGSGGQVELTAGATVNDAWSALLSGIALAPKPGSVRAAQPLSLNHLGFNIDQCLLRALDAHVAAAVKHGESPGLDKISQEILDQVVATWTNWKPALAADAALLAHVLRWLFSVDQTCETAWSGDRSPDLLEKLGNALILTLATHSAEPLTPLSLEHGNLSFADSGVALGSGCAKVGATPIASRTEPDDWGVDALILSASAEIDVRNPLGRVLDGGDRGMSMRVARRVSPAVIQNSAKWRQRLAGDLAAWKAAVFEEFSAMRKRQDDELKELPE